MVHAKSGKLTEPKYAEAVNQASADVAKAPKVAAVVNPLTPQGAAALSKDQKTGYLSVTLAVSPGELSVDEAQKIIDAADPAKAAGLQVETGGQLGQKVSKPATEVSELIGIVAAMVILTITFGTVVSMLLPILNAIVALLLSLAIIRMIGHLTTVPSVAPTLATMIGLGVGIDYALFIVTRHFRGLAEGLDLGESIARATATSGGAVFFAGCTVTIALVSLAVAGIPLVTTMGLMAGIAVVVAVLAALTLLPAGLAITGARINSLRVRKPASAAAVRGGAWARWANGVARQPLLAALAALAILLLLTIPLLSMNLGQQDTAELSTSTTARRAYDLLSENFGPGVNGPLLVTASLASSAEGSTALKKLEQNVAATSGVAATTPSQVDNAGTTAYFNAIPKTGPAEEATASLVQHIRSGAIPSAESGTEMSRPRWREHGGLRRSRVAHLGEAPAADPRRDLAQLRALDLGLSNDRHPRAGSDHEPALDRRGLRRARRRLPVRMAQWPDRTGRTGTESSPRPVVHVAVLFGLSMDYEVFLISQIEEHVHEGEDNRGSVIAGLVTAHASSPPRP